MPFTLILYLYRKPSITPTAFKSHYESTHIPLIQSLTGVHFPQSHRRFYIQRPEDADTKNHNYPATVLLGTQADFQYDAFSELTFEDAARFKAFTDIVGRDDVKGMIAQDEEMFLDRKRMIAVVVGETIMTKGSA